MARIKLGAIITDASGKLGGHAIGRTKNGFVLQNKSVGNKNPSQAQSIKRSVTKMLMAEWSKLSDDQRRLWYLSINDYLQKDRFTNIKKLNGFTLFQKLNQGRLIINQTILSVPGQTHKPTVPGDFNVIYNGHNLIIQSSGYTSNDRIVIYATHGLSYGINQPRKYFKPFNILTGTQINNGIDLFIDYQFKFGLLPDHTQFFLSFQTFSAISGFSSGLVVTQGGYRIAGPPPPPVYDADALLFINAVGSLTDAQKGIINDLVLFYKSNGTWGKYLAIYPFIGGTAAAHKWNLKNPVDTDAAYRLTFNGTVNHNALGINSFGFSGYADTHLIPNNDLVLDNNSFSVYNQTPGVSSANEMGASDGGTTNGMLMGVMFTNGLNITRNMSNAYSPITPTTELGYIMSNRTDLLNRKAVINGTTLTNAQSATGLPSSSVFILSSNRAGVSTNPSNRTLSFVTIGQGLTDSEALNDYNAVQAYQLSLGRNV